MTNIKIAKQYIKDLFIKVPNAPQVFVNTQNKPNIDISIDIDARKISEMAYEVVLSLKANGNESKLFESYVNYAGLFYLESEVEASDLEEILLIHCPRLLFPFARSILSGITADAGFAPLMLDPIDFDSLYQKRKQSITVN